MSAQLINTTGALTLLDGDPSKNVDITTGGTGQITVNGVVPGGGGGAGGDVFLAGAGNVAGVLQTFTCPITVGTGDLTAAGKVRAEGDVEAGPLAAPTVTLNGTSGQLTCVNASVSQSLACPTIFSAAGGNQVSVYGS